jgi:hypothetical protein
LTTGKHICHYRRTGYIKETMAHDITDTITAIQSALEDINRVTPNGVGKRILQALAETLFEELHQLGYRKCETCDTYALKNDLRNHDGSELCDRCYREADESAADDRQLREYFNGRR